jgi:Uma2 family endonuclease
MSTATLPQAPASAQTPAGIEADQSFVLEGVTWDQYVAISDALPDRPGLKITFDGERIEFMTLSRRHERFKSLLGELIEVLTYELNMPRENGGSTTFRSKLIERAIEPDECYWIAHAEEVLGVDEWALGVHPPPDVGIEVDVTSSSIDREAIYARLRIPELWRFDGRTLTLLALNHAGAYEPIEFSLSFPFLRAADLLPFLLRDPPVTQSQIAREFGDWLRDQDFPRL